LHGLFSLPIVLDFMLDLFVVSFGFWFHVFFLVPFVFSADRRPPGLINVPFIESLSATVHDPIAFLRFNLVSIVPVHTHLQDFPQSLFLNDLISQR